MPKTYDVTIHASLVVDDGDIGPQVYNFHINEILERVLKSGRVYAIDSNEVKTDHTEHAYARFGELLHEREKQKGGE